MALRLRSSLFILIVLRHSAPVPIRFLEHIQLDFSGVEFETIQQILREDRSPISTALMSKLIEEKGEDELLIVLADCLKEFIQQGVDNETVKKQLTLYAEA